MGRRKTLDEVRETAEKNHPGITSLLGTRSDPDVADYYELSTWRVQRLRTQLGIDPIIKRVYSRRPGPAPMSIEEVKIMLEEKYPGILATLGVLLDTKIASHYGISPITVLRMRGRLSIPRAPRTRSPVSPSS